MDKILHEISITWLGFLETRPGGVVDIASPSNRLDWFSKFVMYILALVFFSFFGTIGIIWMPLAIIYGKAVIDLWAIPHFIGLSIAVIVIFWIVVSRLGYVDKQAGTKTARDFFNKGFLFSLGLLAFLTPIVFLRTNDNPQGCFASLILPLLFMYNILRDKSAK